VPLIAAGYALGSRSSLSIITLADAGNYLLLVKAIVDSFVEFGGSNGMGRPRSQPDTDDTR
jgi:hypothetical protein